MSQVSRYHPALVILHWLLAVLTIAALVLGALVMVKIPNSDPAADGRPCHRAHADHASSGGLNRELVAGPLGLDLASNALCRGSGLGR